MNKTLLFLLTCIFIFSLVYLILKKNDRPIPASLSLYTTQLYTITSYLSHVQGCQDDNAISEINEIGKINSLAQQIINDKENPPTPSSISTYNSAYSSAESVAQKVSSFPKCNCPQGTYDPIKGCICPPDFPYQMLVNGVTYCNKTSCNMTPPIHGKFIPSDSNDPSKNICACDSGYEHDSNPSDGNCYNIANTTSLSGYGDSINNYSSDLKKYIPS